MTRPEVPAEDKTEAEVRNPRAFRILVPLNP